MEKFISTSTSIFLSLFSRALPHLYKCISKYSLPQAQHKLLMTIGLYSNKQINASLNHSNRIVKSGLNVLAHIYGIKLKINNSLASLKSESEKIREELVNVLQNRVTLGNMSQETETNDQLVNFDERAQHLESEYKTLIECEQTLLGYHKNIDDLLREIDEVVKDHELRWLKHREKYIQKLKENLQIAAGITLTQEETASLKDDYPTSLLNKRKELKKVGINYTKNATSYEILVHYILWQFLSRSFKKPEEEPRIFKTLLSLINEETTDRKKVLVVIKHKYDIIIDNICRLETKLEISTSSTLNSDQKLYNLKLK